MSGTSTQSVFIVIRKILKYSHYRDLNNSFLFLHRHLNECITSMTFPRLINPTVFHEPGNPETKIPIQIDMCAEAAVRN